jgi:choice-of-anchor B domain-containing protein
MKITFALAFTFLFSLSAFAQLNVSYVGKYQYTQDLSDVWGYRAPDGTEYAIVGVYNGVSIINLSDPANPVESDFIPGANSTWRDIKTWGDFAFVTNETSGGLLVIDLSTLPGQVNYMNWSPNIPGVGVLNTCHNLWIDEFGYAYLSGCNVNSGGVLFIDVATTPGTPIYAGKNFPEYSHDVYVRNNIAYSSEINIGEFGVYDVTNKSNPVFLSSQETGGTTTHNAWLSDDSKYLFTTDETGNGPIGSYDVSDPFNIKTLDQFRPLATLGAGVIPHNVHVWQDWIIISYYTDGCIIVDGSRPDNLVEVGNFDTYIPTNTGFNGAWGAYPFLPSGLILISDIGNGLYILQPNYVRACYLEGSVKDAQTGNPIPGATVDILNDLAIEQSKLDGQYKTGLAMAGTYPVEVSKPGYIPATATVKMVNGQVTLQDFELQPLPSFSLNGKVTDEATGEPIEGAKVQVVNNDFEFNVTTDADGQFEIPGFFEGNYDVLAGKWGYKTGFLNAQAFNENNNNTQIVIGKAIEDVFSLDLGWTIESNTNNGAFELGNPIGVSAPVGFPLFIQPEDDSPNDAGNSCYVTGNLADLFSGIQVNGVTRIISPEFDLSGMYEPHVSFESWFFNIGTNGASPGNDKLVVKINNGTETKTLALIGYTFPNQPAWNPSDFDVKSFLTPTATMHISFEIGDNDPGNIDAIEAGIDYFRAYDANPNSTDEPGNGEIHFSAFPNPSGEDFTVSYRIEKWEGEAQLLVFNALGERIEMMKIEQPEGQLHLGSDLKQGVYFIQVQQAGDERKVLKVVKF